jgi:hypothetical protein
MLTEREKKVAGAIGRANGLFLLLPAFFCFFIVLDVTMDLVAVTGQVNWRHDLAWDKISLYFSLLVMCLFIYYQTKYLLSLVNKAQG